MEKVPRENAELLSFGYVQSFPRTQFRGCARFCANKMALFPPSEDGISLCIPIIAGDHFREHARTKRKPVTSILSATGTGNRIHLGDAALPPEGVCEKRRRNA